MANLKLFMIKKLDDILIYTCHGDIGDIDAGTSDDCTINGTMKGTGMVIKGSFIEQYTDSDITRTVNAGEMFSTNMGNTSGVVITAAEDGSENFIIMPRGSFSGGIIVTEFGKLNDDEEIVVTGDYLVTIGDGIIVDDVSYPGEDGFRLSEDKAIKGMTGTTFFMSYNRIKNPDEFVMLRTATDRDDVAVIGS